MGEATATVLEKILQRRQQKSAQVHYIPSAWCFFVLPQQCTLQKYSTKKRKITHLDTKCTIEYQVSASERKTNIF
jgi:hypothetical protein